MTISPSRTQPGREVGQEGADEPREVPVERLLVARAELDLVPVAEDDAAEAVPLRLVDEVLRQAAGSRDSLASMGFTGGITGRSTAQR
jgi:hypothetical protein